MTILDKQAADSTGLRVFGHLDADELIVQYGNPDGGGMQMPNGQTHLRLSVQAIRDLVRSADVAAQEAIVPATSPDVRAQGNPGLGPTGL